MKKDNNREERVKELISKLNNIRLNQNNEQRENHEDADEILIDIIKEYGHPEVEDIFYGIDKWYS